MRALLTTVGREALRYVRWPSVVLLGAVVPLVVTVVLVTTVGEALDDTSPFRFAVVDNDGGPVAAGFVDSLADLEEDGTVVVIGAGGIDEAQRLVDEGNADAGFLIPAGFSTAVEAYQPAVLSVLVAPGSGMEGDVAQSIAESYAVELNAVQLSVAAALAVEGDVPPERQRSLVASAEAGRRLIKLRQEDRVDTAVTASRFFALSLPYVFLFLFVQLLVIGLCPHGRLGTVVRILFACGLGIGAMAVLWFATGGLLGTRWGEPVGALLLACAAVAAAAGLALLSLGASVTTKGAAFLGASAAVVFAALGGMLHPTSRTSETWHTAGVVSPHRWLIDAQIDLSVGAPVSEIVPAILVCLGFGVVTGFLGRRLTGRRRARVDGLHLGRHSVVVSSLAVLISVAVLALTSLAGVGPQPRIGVVNRDSGVLGVSLVRGIEELDGVAVTTFGDADEARRAIDRGQIDAVVILAYDHTSRLASTYTATVRYVSTETAQGFEAQPLVVAVIDDQSVRARAARFTATETGVTFDEAVIVVGRVAGTIEGVTVAVSSSS